MSRFVFKLEPVLRQRCMIEDERQRDLAKLMRRQMILKNQIRSMQDTISESKRDLSQSLLGKVDLALVGNFARYSGQVTHRARQIVVELARLEKEIHAARQRLVDATRDRKAIELLRDRRLAAWKKEQRRRENIELDEVGTQRYIRQMMTGAMA